MDADERDRTCTTAETAKLLGLSAPTVVRRAGALGGVKNGDNEWAFSWAAVRRERSRILDRLNAVEKDALAAEIEELQRRIQELLLGRDELLAAREADLRLMRSDQRVIRSYETPASPDQLVSRHR